MIDARSITFSPFRWNRISSLAILLGFHETGMLSSLGRIPMSTTENLIKVKTALAEKYERLARIAGSVPKRKQFANRAVAYRRQVAQLSHTSREG